MKYYFAAHTKKLDKYLSIFTKIINTINDSGWVITDDWLKREIKAQNNSSVDYYNYYKDLYNRTSKKIKSSDVLIAEISEKSTTVAQQIVYALENNIPVWCLYEESNKNAVPAFISTRKDKKLRISEYKESNLVNILEKGMKNYSRREVKFNFYLSQEMNDFLEKQATRQKAPKSEVVRNLILKIMKNKS